VAHHRGTHVLFDRDVPALLTLVDGARDARVRCEPECGLHDVAEWAAGLKERIEAGSLSADDVRSLYRWGHEFFVLQRRQHRFPGAYVEKALNLAIKGLHYETVMRGIADGTAGGMTRGPNAPSPPMVSASRLGRATARATHEAMPG
jgi:hypothetical protein